MITQETAGRIWNCYREIETAQELLKELTEKLKTEKDDTPLGSPGRRNNYQLGIPFGDTAHTLYNVQPKLALSVIRAHIAEKERELVEANEQARIELDSGRKEPKQANCSERTKPKRFPDTPKAHGALRLAIKEIIELGNRLDESIMSDDDKFSAIWTICYRHWYELEEYRIPG